MHMELVHKHLVHAWCVQKLTSIHSEDKGLLHRGSCVAGNKDILGALWNLSVETNLDIAQYKRKYNTQSRWVYVIHSDSKWWRKPDSKSFWKEIGLVKENILEKVKLKHHLTQDVKDTYCQGEKWMVWMGSRESQRHRRGSLRDGDM